MLTRVAWLLKALFGTAARLTGARPTHRHGVGGTGTLRIVDRPTFPDHDFFRPGATFPVCLRHANLDFADDASLDIRGAALRLATPDAQSPLDLVMNTGEASLFRDAIVFLQFVRSKRHGAAGLQWMAEQYPREMAVGVDGLRRAPSSYAALRYHSQIIFGFAARDHRPRYCRYRMIGEGSEEGIPESVDRTHPLNQGRRPDESRPPDYLRQEWRARLAAGPVIYRLQIQVRDVHPDDVAEVLDTSRTWDLPWQELATVVLDQALADAATERLRFNIANHPPSLGILRATSIHDYNGIGWLRTQVYPHSQLRRLGNAAPSPLAVGSAHREPLATEEVARLYDRLPDDLRREVSAFVATRSALRSAPSARSYRVVGRLVHEDRSNMNADKPLHHVEVELWDRDIGSPDDFLGRGETDAEGRFEIAYDPADAGIFDVPDLDLRVFDHTTGARKLIATFAGPDDCRDPAFDFGTLRLPFWEYTDGLPRLWVPPGADPPQDFSAGRKLPLLQNLTRHLHTRLLHQAASDLTYSKIQADYPENLTRRLERERPGHTRSDAWFVDRTLNGFYPAPLRLEDGKWRVDYVWDNCEMQVGDYELPNASARFEVRENELHPVDLTLQFRLPGGRAPHSPLAEPVVITPADGDRWTQAKRIFRVAHFLAGEMDGHLTRSHLDVEQYAIAAFRNLRKNPLRLMLFPHLKEVVVINNQRAWLVFGDTGYIPRASALTARTCERRFADEAGTLDWYSWRPPAPILPTHRWANVANLYWSVLETYVAGFFEQNREGIVRFWGEVHAMSEDAVGRSVAWRGPDIAGPERTVIHGHPRAVRPFAPTPEPVEADLANMRQLCAYVIFQATLWHTWVNDLQFEDGGDPTYGSLGLRNGSFGAEDDHRIGPRLVDASDQIYLTKLLTGIQFGFIMRNEDGDVPALLRELLAARKAEFEAAGFGIERIRSRVNI